MGKSRRCQETFLSIIRSDNGFANFIASAEMLELAKWKQVCALCACLLGGRAVVLRWSMKKAIILLSVCGCLAPAFALPTFEPFANATASGGTAYANSATLVHQTNSNGEGWAQWSGSELAASGVSCTNAGLSYGTFPAAFPPPSPTNAAYLPGQVDNAGGFSGLSAALNLSKSVQADPNNLATNKIFASFLIQVPNLGNLSSSSPIYFGGFATNAGDQNVSLPASAAKIFLTGNSGTVGSSTTWSIGIANNSGSGSAHYDGGGHTSNTVLFVVVDYEFGINGNADVAQIWVNPAAASFGAAAPPAATTNISITAPNNIAQAADFFLLDRTGGTIWGRLFVSDLRLGTTWSYVTGGPGIATPPASITNTPFTTANFQVSAASGSLNNPLSYRWQKNGVNLTNGNDVSGATTASLALSNVTQTNTGTYSVIVSNVFGVVTNFAVLTMLDPYIVTQPASVQNLPTGSTANFPVTATGTALLTCQWKKNGVNLSNGSTGHGSTVSGATTTNLTISGLATNDSGTYTLAVTNGLGNTVSGSNSVLTVNDPIIVSGPQNVLTNYGGGASFTVAVAGTSPFGYQWLKNGANLSDGPATSGSGAIISVAHGTNLLITGLAYKDSGSYSVIVTNHVGNTLTSSPAVLTVIDPYVVTPPVNQTNVFGTTATFSVVASGTSPIGYQWQENGVALSDNGHDVGTATANLTIFNVSAADVGTYSVVVSGASQLGGTQNSITNSAFLAVSSLATVDPTFVLVTNFEGWGTSLCWWANVIGGYSNRDVYADLAFTQLKLNIVRYNIGGGQNPNGAEIETFYAAMQGFEPTNGVWDWTADANQRWMLQAALARGVNIVEAFANSPPWWMTYSGSPTGSVGGNTNNLQVAYEDTFAVYLATVISNLTVLDGVHFNYVTPMNEPAATWTYGNFQEGNHLSSDQQARVVNDLRAALNAQGLATGIDASEDEVPSILNELSVYDSYGYSPPPLSTVNIMSTHYTSGQQPALRQFALTNGVPVWVTEDGHNDTNGIVVARHIHDDLMYLWVPVWINWQVVKDDSHVTYGLLYNPMVSVTNIQFTTNYIIHETFYVMGQYSEFISPGSEIINVGDTNTVAAYNPTNQTLVLVTVNDSGSAFSTTFDLSAFSSLPAQISAYRTSSNECLVILPPLSVTNNRFTAAFPVQSVTTFVLTNIIPTPVSSSAAAWYPLDGNALDASGHGYNGVIFGNVAFVPGNLFAQAAQFDGLSSYVQIPLSISNNFTISCWVNTTKAGGTGQWWAGKGIMDGYVQGTTNDFGLSLVGNEAAFGVGNPDTTILSTTPINDGQWHHIAATRDAVGGTMKLFVDGALQASALGPAGTQNAPPSLRIGSIQTGVTTGFFAGTIGDAQLFDYAFADSQISQLMNHPPSLNVISNVSILAGRTLLLTNSASDPCVPPQTLSWSLLNPPSGAAIAGLNATNSLFTWRPAISQSPATNYLAVVVSNNGTPSMSATQNFMVTVLPPAQPQILAPTFANGISRFDIAGDGGPDYIVEGATNLAPPVLWSPLTTNLSAAPPFLWSNSAALVPRQFYRVRLGP
jgi:O-glycosyl hydrolase